MSVFSCLAEAPPPPGERIFGEGAFEIVAVCVIVSIAVAAIASPLLRRAYRRRVTRLMGLNQVRPRPPGWWSSRGGAAPRDAATGLDTSDANALAALARARELRVALATGAGWLAFVLAALLGVRFVDPSLMWHDRLGFATFAAALALAPAWINLPLTYRRRVLAVGLLLVVGMLLLYAELDTADAVDALDDDDIVGWFGAVGLGGVYLTLFHRSLRGQVLPVGVLVSVFVLCAVFAIGFLEGHLGSCLSQYSTTESPGSDEQTVWGSTFAGIGAILAMLGVWLGFRALRGVANLVERGWLGELSMASVLALAIVSLTMVLAGVPDDATGTLGWAGLLPIPWLAGTAGAYALAMAWTIPAARGPQLLVLRVFSKEKQKQALLDRMQARWRYVGAVHQIGGPDMVALNVDPYECAMFLGGDLHDLFLPEAASREDLEGRLDTAPDREGRHRINEVFCFNTAWRRTVAQLMHLSDAIVLDLRGLTAEREGTSYEIGVLAREKLLPRVVAVGDDETDWEHVDSELRQAGHSLDDLERLDVVSSGSAEGLFNRLLQVAVRPLPAAG